MHTRKWGLALTQKIIRIIRQSCRLEQFETPPIIVSMIVPIILAGGKAFDCLGLSRVLISRNANRAAEEGFDIFREAH